ncbi:MAG: RNA polymerase sigma factor [Candidatus Colwellbacteria bacterium]|nr:RNA polymerase sigma factor [Candidatus Colwellbacteria bacterium]
MRSHRREFESVYKKYADAIFRYLYYRLQNRERALELVQEVFTRYWQYLLAGKKIENSKAFLYRSAANAFVNEIRTNKREVSLDEMLKVGFEVRYEDAEIMMIAPQEQVVQRLKGISERYREVLVMRYIEEMKVKEIAQILGTSENNISARISRGLKQLRKIYEQDA